METVEDQSLLKVPKCEVLISWILMIFFIMKSLQVGDFRDEIKILHFLQMGEIWAILFLLPHAPSTLANCYRMRSIRQHWATACAAYASNWLPHTQHTLAKHRIFDNLLPYAQCTLANCYRMRSIRLQIHQYAKHTLAICYRKRSVRQQSATACAAYACKQHNFTQFCYRMRSVRQQFATVCEVCASKVLPFAQSALAICYRMRSVR